MSEQYTGLGKGLASLIPDRLGAEKIGVSPTILGPKEQLHHIDPVLIGVNPQQPRKTFEHGGIEDLVNSIKTHGILQPLIVSKAGDRYELISGERRLRAAKLLELDTVPVIVRKASEQEKLALALIENVQRRDLNAIERAWGYARLIEEFSLTQEEAAKNVGQSRVSVTNTLRLLKLPDDIQKALIEGTITEGHAKVLLGIEHPTEQKKVFLKILKDQFSVRATEEYVRISPAHARKSKSSSSLPEHDDAIDRLQSALGTKVEIARVGRKGTIRIHWYSPEELSALIRKLTS